MYAWLGLIIITSRFHLVITNGTLIRNHKTWITQVQDADRKLVLPSTCFEETLLYTCISPRIEKKGIFNN